MQNEMYKKQHKKCNIWLEQNFTPRRTSTIKSMIEQMIETRAWRNVRGLTENSHHRLFKEQETVQHFLAGCKMLARSKYLTRNHKAVMVMAVVWEKNKIC